MVSFFFYIFLFQFPGYIFLYFLLLVREIERKIKEKVKIQAQNPTKCGATLTFCVDARAPGLNLLSFFLTFPHSLRLRVENGEGEERKCARAILYKVNDWAQKYDVEEVVTRCAQSVLTL